MDWIEKHDGRDDGQPDQNDVDEAEIGAVQAEEERRPRSVENELHSIHRQRQAGAGEAGFPPDQPAGDRNHHIEYGPHRGEKPVRRPPGRLLQLLVPFARPKPCAGQRREETGGDEASESNDQSNFH